MTGAVDATELTYSLHPLTPEVLHEQLGNRMKAAPNAAPKHEPQPATLNPQRLTLERISRYIDENIKPSE